MISVPGKIFIFGEYSVMNGGEAILAAVKPGFDCDWNNTNRVHPDSPAGRFLTQNKSQVLTSVQGGLGAGFGSSTAELLAANQCLHQPWSLDRLWTWYHEEFSPASGADLVVQEQGRTKDYGFYHFQIQGPSFRVNPTPVPFLFQENCFVFKTSPTQKIPTYSDLENKKDSSVFLPVDQTVANRFIHRWLETFDPKILTEWADYLAKLGFESIFAHDVRKAFLKVPGVLGVKGCGAGLNDVFLVSVEQGFHAKMNQRLAEVAEKFDLSPLGNLSSHV